MNTVSFCTLGCKVNQYETEAMKNLFAAAGYTVKNFDEICDVYVINTCTVTGIGDRKSRQFIHRAAKLNPNAVIAVAGCYSQVAPDEIAAIEGVNVVIGAASRDRIVHLVERAMEQKQKIVNVTDIMKQRSYEDLQVASYSSKTRAFVKIEDGCNEFCSYCIIPYARGPVRSRSLESIENEVCALARNGFKEIVLTGIHIASYGKDKIGGTLADVVQVVDSVGEIERIRLGSLEPRILTEDFVKQIKKSPKICNHFHISLQSGCDETLRRMNRKYTTADYERGVNLLREYYGNPAIAADIMVGFPGESEEEFEKSLAFANKIRFADAHVFSYSNRRGTRADKMENQVAPKEKERRARIMGECISKLKKSYSLSNMNTSGRVLVEREISPSLFEGHMSNYQKVHIHSENNLCGQFANVLITAYSDGALIGELQAE